MKIVPVRDLLRYFKTLFPLPPEGVHVTRRDGDFFMYPFQVTLPEYEVLAEKVAEKVARKLRESPPAQPLPVPPEPSASVSDGLTADAAYVEVHEAPHCGWELIASGAGVCSDMNVKKVKIASLAEGTPIASDWKELFLCPHHLNVVKQANMFEVEESV